MKIVSSKSELGVDSGVCFFTYADRSERGQGSGKGSGEGRKANHTPRLPGCGCEDGSALKNGALVSDLPTLRSVQKRSLWAKARRGGARASQPASGPGSETDRSGRTEPDPSPKMCGSESGNRSRLAPDLPENRARQTGRRTDGSSAT